MTPRHLVLVGLPGSGKSTVGSLVAERLRRRFVDLDAVIVRRMGMPVDRIFGEFGEARFRELEREATGECLAAEPGVIAPGGGWAADPANLSAARSRSFLCYLEVEPGVAFRRAGQGVARPLLRGGEGLVRMTALLADRKAAYEQADFTVPNGGDDPAVAAARIVDWIRTREGA